MLSKISLRGRKDILETRTFVLRARTPIRSDDRVFVLIHGLGLSHRVYGRLASRLTEHGTVVGVDLPGFGGIRRPTSAVSVQELAECMAHVLSELNVTSAVVIGHSMGAQIALELTIRAPHFVEALVFVGPVVDPRRHSLLLQGLALARDSALEPLATKLRVLRDYSSCGFVWFLTEAREMMKYRTELKVRQLEVPLLVIRGQNDVIAPADWSDWLAARGFPGRAESIPGHRHVVIHSAPGPTAEVIADFASTVRNPDVA